MIPVDTRSAAQHRFWRYAGFIFKTVFSCSGAVFAYYLIYKGFL
jgi:hypothetical protein